MARRDQIWGRLKPAHQCPFCGGEATVIVSLNRTDGARRYAIRCEACEARGPVKDTPAEANSAWLDREDPHGGR